MTAGDAPALVLGGGGMGLTSALRLQEAGFTVQIWTAARWPETVSNVSAALWYPFRVYPAERVEAWGDAALRVFQGLASDPDAGVRLREGRVLWRSEADARAGEPVPVPAVPIPPAELPAGYEHGQRVEAVPSIEMPIYLPWLERRFTEAGGELELRTARSLDEALDVCPLVVNCTGLGAGELAGDPLVHPIRGQVVRVENPGIERFTLDESPGALSYVIPRSRHVILGGTAEDGEWDLVPDAEVARGIRERCEVLEPSLVGAPVVAHAVGLRPGRPAVRLEREDRGGGRRIIHNYGHGGAGVTISWGCADEVARLASASGDS